MVKTIDAMESDRPHHPIRTLSRNSSSTSNPNPTNTTTTTSELLVCFTSRLSSSSTMKISKSILSPGRSGRDPPSQISLSSSLSRRFRANNSLKGGQSPMFPTTTGGKKKGGAGFENPEPSSPKVTCIGQVRVKSRRNKAGSKKIVRSRSQRRSGEYSFRRIESSTAFKNRDMELDMSSQRHGHNGNSNNQKWVHIPVTICETIRSLGSDFNCFLPCTTRSSCGSDRAHNKPVDAVSSKGDGCGSVLARWLVAVEDDGVKGRRRQIELVVGDDDDCENEDREDGELCGRQSYRKRHVMEDIDVRAIERELRDKVAELGAKGEAAANHRVSVCVPPKNALLLMRCRSDPVKVAALANKFLEPPIPVLDEDVEEEKEVNDAVKVVENGGKIEKQEEEVVLKECEREQVAMEVVVAGAEQDIEEEAMLMTVPGAEEFEVNKMEDESFCDKLVMTEEMDEDVLEDVPRFSVHMVEAGNGDFDEGRQQSDLEMEELEDGLDASEDEIHDVEQVQQEQEAVEVDEAEICDDNVAEDDHHIVIITSPASELDEVEIGSHENASVEVLAKEDEAEFECEEEEHSSEPDDSESETEEEEQEAEEEETAAEKKSSSLPECLLLMMREPKLSMEVSKETWVCTTDFIRWLPPREVKKKKDCTAVSSGDELSKRVSVHYKPPQRAAAENTPFLPSRSSCSYPAPPPKLKPANSAACDPFSLKRCKSEPGRNAAKFGPAHRAGAPVGVGVGVGF